MSQHDVLIVGAGLAGLACAVELQRGGLRPLILEATDGVGGRVRTDDHQGFLLDRGFQVLLEAYPECRRLLDYEALDLKPFYPGARIWTGDGFTRFSDPYRRPGDAMATLASPLGSFSDKLKVPELRRQVLKGSPEDLLQGPDLTILEDLQELGFGDGMIDGFFRPFFGGVLLDPELKDSSRIFRYIFRMFSKGDISVPARGMGEIPAQLLGLLGEDRVRLGARVARVEPGRVALESGEEMRADAIVVAAEGPEAARLLGAIAEPSSKGTVCLYFEAPEPPVKEAVLLLDGVGSGPVNNVAVMSQVSPHYAPPGKHLVAASCLGIPPDSPEALEERVLQQMGEWFGVQQARQWKHLKSYRIPHAQPGQPPGTLEPAERGVLVEEGLWVCGDHRETASLQGALHSGVRAAESVLKAQREGREELD
jgi:phytoene dehydrogenase-like protein